MKTMYELRSALSKISQMYTSDHIPLTVDGREIDTVEVIDDKVVIKTKKPTLRELYKDNSLGETIMIDDDD